MRVGIYDVDLGFGWGLLDWNERKVGVTNPDLRGVKGNASTAPLIRWKAERVFLSSDERDLGIFRNVVLI